MDFSFFPLLVIILTVGWAILALAGVALRTNTKIGSAIAHILVGLVIIAWFLWGIGII